MRYLDAVTMVKDEKRAYLEEWVEYHYALGINHFTFYNNGSKIAPLPHSTIVEAPGRPRQESNFRNFIHHRMDSHWLAVFDVDEFIVPIAWPSLPAMLSSYEDFGGLVISWLLFGSNGVPDNDIAQTLKFTRRGRDDFPANKHIKTIGRTDAIANMTNPHYFHYKPGHFAVNPNKVRVDGPFGPTVVDKVRIHHYGVRSLPELHRKAMRGGASGDPVSERLWLNWDRQLNVTEDTTAIKVRERVLKQMQNETPLCQLAQKWKTDKTPRILHSYTPYYHSVLKDKPVQRMLELGIGYPEDMKHVLGYAAGASLRMWREYFPQAEIYALDINRDVLINETRIHSFYCDERNDNSMRAAAEQLGGNFDLIIDDGSHHPLDQINAAKFLLPLLAPDGVYIIEDVPRPDMIVAALPCRCEVIPLNTTRYFDDTLVRVYPGQPKA